MDDYRSSYLTEDDEKPVKGVSISVWQAEIALRLSFLRKVYAILTAQLLLTVIIGGVCIAVSPVKRFVQTRMGDLFIIVMTRSTVASRLFRKRAEDMLVTLVLSIASPTFSIVLFAITLVTLVGLIIKRHEAPANYYLLLAFTVSEGLSVGTAVTFYDVDLVLKSLFITTMVFMALTAYTMQSKYDFSTWGASLFSFLWILIIGGLLQIFFWSETLEFVLSIAGAVVFCGFIIFDTHMIMHKLSTEEYIMAAINLYLDFINLFLYILRILQAARKN